MNEKSQSSVVAMIWAIVGIAIVGLSYVLGEWQGAAIAIASVAILSLIGPKITPKIGKALVKMDMASQLSKSKLKERSMILPNGRTAWYLERESDFQSNEKPLVIVPGLSVYMHLMGVQLSGFLKLIPNRRVIIFELPYHGKRATIDTDFSDPGCSLDGMTSSLEKFLDIIGLNGSFDLLGYSLGGSIATNFTIKHPDRVNRLVLLAPYYYSEASTEAYNTIFEAKQWSKLAAWRNIGEMEDWFHNWLGLDKKDSLPGFIMNGLVSLRSELYPENHWERFYEQLHGDSKSSLSFLEDNKSLLSIISSPVLLFAATNDKICDFEKLTSLKNVFNPNLCNFKSLNAGHTFAPNGQTLFEEATDDMVAFLTS